MIVRVSEIPDEGIQVTSPADVGDVFPEEGWSLDAVDLGIARRGAEVGVTGSFQASARLQCSRCLEPLLTRVGPAVDLHLLPSPATRHEQTELGPDDLEVDFYQGDILDLARLLLCPVCGGNRNVTACACGGREVDPRLAPLEALRRRSQGER
jgi:uncharacterized metal-binding protein YceD (DUF177 family)